MTTTLADLKQRILDRVDPDRLLDLLNLTTEQLVAAFGEEIEEKFDDLYSELYEDDEEPIDPDPDY